MPIKQGDKYRPSNGTEGEMFMEEFCYRCAKDYILCNIIDKTMIYDLNDPEYPNEWQFDENLNAVCTEYKVQP